MLPEGQLTILAWLEKSGKTLIATDLACAIALGQPFLGRESREGVVIFAVLEENLREVKERILERVDSHYDEANIPLMA